METSHPVWASRDMTAARAADDLGGIVRHVRVAAGLTQAQLAARLHCSTSTLSRLETGRQPLTNTATLRLLAKHLRIPSEVLGLADDISSRHDGSVTAISPSAAVGVVSVGRDDGAHDESGDGPVRRRDLLARLTGLAGAAAFGLPQAAHTYGVGDPAGGVEDLLLRGATTQPVPLTTLRSAATQARSDFQAARYDRLAAGLPTVIGTAHATRDHTDGDNRLAASALLADAYIVAANFMVKLNDDPLAWTTADRALQAALLSEDPLTIADARRSIATVLRRTGRAAKARDLVISAAHDIQPHGMTTPAQLSMYGTLLQVAAYTAAVDGDRAGASQLIAEATAASRQLGRDANHRHTAFGPSNVTLYQLSIAQVLGDNGAAIAHAKTLPPAAIPTPERRGRYWIDVARAYHQWGKAEHCYRALLYAERAAPAEVRYRPPVRRVTEDLVRVDRRRALPGLRTFAARIGAL